jgi:hypothetical protein
MAEALRAKNSIRSSDGSESEADHRLPAPVTEWFGDLDRAGAAAVAGAAWVRGQPLD